MEAETTSEELRKRHKRKRKREGKENDEGETRQEGKALECTEGTQETAIGPPSTKKSNGPTKEKTQRRKEKRKNKRRRAAEDTQPQEHVELLASVTGHIKMPLNEDQDSEGEGSSQETETNHEDTRTNVTSSEPVVNGGSKVNKECAMEYLHQWSDRDTSGQWSFKKKTQYWLLQSMYHKSKVPKSEFEILLRYLEGLKGHQKELTVDKARKTMEQEEVSKRRYERAVAILRALA